MWGPAEPGKTGGPPMFPTLLQSLKQVGPGTACVCSEVFYVCVHVCGYAVRGNTDC